MESADHARGRNARVYAELEASGETTDTGLLEPENAGDGTALQRAAHAALEAAGCGADELGAVFADGLGTEQDDLREAGVLEKLLLDAPVPVTAPTAAIGFTGAASGAFSLAHAALAMRSGVVPPLLGRHDPDPRCHVHALDRAEPLARPRALVWNSDRGVKNVAVLIDAYAP